MNTTLKKQGKHTKKNFNCSPTAFIAKDEDIIFGLLWYYFGAFSVLSKLKINQEIELLEILKSLNTEKVVFNSVFYRMQSDYAAASFYA